MPRSASKSPPTSRAPSRAVTPTPTFTMPTVAAPAPAPTFGQVLKEGFAFGAGSAVARNVVDRMFTPSPVIAPPAPLVPPSDPPCAIPLKELSNCYKSTHFDGACQVELATYMECMKTEKPLAHK